MKFSRESVKINSILLILFLINPVVSLVGSTLMMYLKKINTSLVVALSLALILIYFPIMYDTSANFFSFYLSASREDHSLYLYFPIVVNSYLGIDINYMSYIYIYTVFVVYVWSDILFKQFEKNKNMKWGTLTLIILFWFTFTYRDVMDLHRTILAFSIFFYWFYLTIDRERINYIAFIPMFLLSISIHPFAFLLWCVYWISNFISIGYRLALVVFIFSMLVGFVLNQLLPMLSLDNIGNGIPMVERFKYYIFSEKWGNRQDVALGSIMKKALIYFTIILMFILLLSFKRNHILQKTEQLLFNFSVILCSLTVLFVYYVTFFERLSMAVLFLNAILLFQNIAHYMLRAGILFSLVFKTSMVFIFIQSIIFFGDYSETLPDTDAKLIMMSKPFMLPTVMLLDVEEHGYSDKYLYEHSIWGKYGK